MAEFTGATYDEAVLEAEKQFNTKSDKLEIAVLEEGPPAGKRAWRISADWKHVTAAAAEDVAKGRDKVIFEPDSGARIVLHYLDEGVAIEAPREATDIEVNSYIARRGLRGYDLPGARKALDGGAKVAPLAPAQEAGPPAPDEVFVSFSKDDMTATLQLFPGDAEGARLTFDDIMEKLTGQYRIVCGIDEELVRRVAAETPYRQHIEIAHGRMPKEGDSAKIEYHFRQTTSMRPRLLDGDKVDYRTLDLFETVRAGQVLVTRTPPTQGVDGLSLRGRPLRARSGKDAQLPRGKGVTISEDKCTMTADTDGMVSVKDRQVVVASRYVVPENVDMSTGNIEFTGDIEVKGNVISGMTLKAEGNIEVHGVVEAATIIAGGGVVLHQGMQGTGRGLVKAGGDVTAKYFERVTVSAGGMISADAIYHSDCSAVEGINLAGKHASLIGGVSRSAHVVSARTIGSTSATATIVEVGILPEQRERLVHLENELARLNNEKGKIALLVKTYGAAPGPDETPERAALRQRVVEANRQIVMQIAEATTERNRLKAETESVTGGRVHAVGTVYPGTKVVIGAAVYNVEQPIDFATFRVRDGEVSFVACEL